MAYVFVPRPKPGPSRKDVKQERAGAQPGAPAGMPRYLQRGLGSPGASAQPEPSQDDDKLAAIRRILSSSWVGPVGEYELESAWRSFGDRLPAVASANWQLFMDSVERGAELDDIDVVQSTRMRFSEDVRRTAHQHLSANRRLVQEEKERLGLADSASSTGTTARERINALWSVRNAASLVLRAREAQRQLSSLQVGYDWLVEDVPGGGQRSRLEPATFNPHHPPMLRPRGDEEPPLPAWSDVKAHHERLLAVITGLASTSPALYALLQGEGLEAVGTGSAEQASTAIRAALDRVLHSIDATEPKIDNGDLDYRDLIPIHEQLFAGAAAPSGTHWNEAYPRWVAQELLSSHQATEFWVSLGLGSLAAAAFLLAEFATLGSATFFLAAGVGVLAGGTQAARSWEQYEDLSEAARTHVTDETTLVSQGQASGALLTAILDTAFAFVDVYSPLARGISAGAAGAERVAARQALGAGEREVAERSARESAEQGGREGLLSVRRAQGPSGFFTVGPENAPTLEEVQAFLGSAWTHLRGARGKEPAISLARLPPTTGGQLQVWKIGEPDIAINVRMKFSRGALANTVYHEAWHARFRQLFPALRNSPVWDVLTRYLDEWIAYTIGGAARVRHGATTADRLKGLIDMLTAGVDKYGSLEGIQIVPALINDVVLALGFIAVLYQKLHPKEPGSSDASNGTPPGAP